MRRSTAITATSASLALALGGALWATHTWHVETVDPDFGAGDSCLALDALDRPHIAHVALEDASPYREVLLEPAYLNQDLGLLNHHSVLPATNSHRQQATVRFSPSVSSSGGIASRHCSLV